ncbi:MAG TPA: hypothetical protein ENH06_01520 [bacterium]|nr:hypothetical protein [bacterium]
METKNKVILIVGVIIFIASVFIVFSPKQEEIGLGEYDEFAKCLSNEGVKIYGAYWCPHCKNQKEMFGNSWQYVEYIECSLPGGSGQKQVCKDAKINSYPTWEFKDGERKTGELSFEQLKEKTKCEIN